MMNSLIFGIMPYLFVYGIMMDVVGPVFKTVLLTYVLVFVVPS